MTHDNPVSAVAFSPDGKYVVSGVCDKTDENQNCIEGTARVWEAETGREVARMTHESYVSDVAFSPDGKYVVSGGWDGTARVWEAQSGHEVARMIHDNWVSAVAFSPDGRLAVSGGCDVFEYVRIYSLGERGAITMQCTSGGARVWDVKTGREVTRMSHVGDVEAIAFSPDGKHVVSGSDDGTARVWEVKTGHEVARMTHDGRVFAVAFSPDGKYVVSGSEDGTARVRLWRPEDLIAEACRRLPRNLTLAEWQQYVGPEVPYHATCPGKPLPEDIMQFREAQRAQRQRQIFWGGVAFMGTLALVMGWQVWRRKGQARLRWFYGAALSSSTALIAAWQAWNAWKGLTPFYADLVGIALLIAISAMLARSSRQVSVPGKGRLILIGLFLLLEGYAGIVYVTVVTEGQLPALPGAKWIWEGWYWLFSPVDRLQELPLSWIDFSMLWVQWLGAALLLLFTTWSVLQVVQGLPGLIRRRQK